MRDSKFGDFFLFAAAAAHAVLLAGVASCEKGDAAEKTPAPAQNISVQKPPSADDGVKTADQGRDDKLSAHIKALAAHDWRMRKNAAEQLASLGKEAEGAVPALIKALFDKDDEVRTTSSAALGAIGTVAVLPLVEMLEQTLGKEVDDARIAVELSEAEWNGVSNAVQALKKMGPEARNAADVLMRIVKSKCKDPRETPGCYAAQGLASDALGRIGAGAVSVLMNALGRGDQAMRDEAAIALGKIGKDAAEAVPALTEMLRSEQQSACEAAAVALSGIGEPAIPALVAALHEQRPMVREPAVKALIRMGPSAKTAVPELKKLLSDPKKWTRRAAEEALDGIER